MNLIPVAEEAERLRSDLDDLKTRLRRQYTSATDQVQSQSLRKNAAAIAERWLVEISGREDVRNAIGADLFADLNVVFQRLLNLTEKAAIRSKYDEVIKDVLRDFGARIVVPLKRTGNSTVSTPMAPPSPSLSGAFLGHSFDAGDRRVVDCVRQSLEAIGIPVTTGERPRADRISDKVKRFIDAQPVFVGLYTRRDKVARRKEWTTSPWVIEEKAYAAAMGKRLVLLKEEAVSSIGGIQGDYEYIEFSRDLLENLVLRLLNIFAISNAGFRK